ncbi:disulfide bond formation protein DsbA [Burkholderia sp. Bp9012]|uniref:DsbA family protein n=1 Tax=Burkholderia sp. Bp9012 TaxID=2184562 RepID=UPI000F5A6EFE|nr:thioredoxin domain-containing protein [Burkholderia sp. Bp9012]RQR79242.1 disulfide bond formation protein DsbA [Burkholderia sp. Bp9012]
MKHTTLRRLNSIQAKRFIWPVSLAAVLCLIALTLSLQLAPWHPRSTEAGPPWIYGDPHVRFTIIEYADLECPYCRAYYSELRHWIDAHHDVNWQWRHFPLPMHEPAARQEAKLVECAGRTEGQEAFWIATAWVYAHTRGNGDGVPSTVPFPGLDHAIERCLQEPTVDSAIQRDVDQGQREQVPGTPTLKILDHTTGRTLIIPGPARGDALLSAIDQLAAAPSLAVPTNHLNNAMSDPKTTTLPPR